MSKYKKILGDVDLFCIKSHKFGMYYIDTCHLSTNIY